MTCETCGRHGDDFHTSTADDGAGGAETVAVCDDCIAAAEEAARRASRR